MERLQVDVPKGTRQRLKTEARERGMLLSPYVSELLSAKTKAQPKTKAVVTVDPGVQQVIDHFEKRIGKMNYMVTQTRVAKELIAAHGLHKTLGAINAASESNGQEFAPTISSLKQLRDKWISLESFWHRQKPKVVTV